MSKISRREFLSRSAIGAAAVVTSTAGLTVSARAQGSNDRISVGVIGVGTYGTALMKDLHRFDKELNFEITAVCDVWRPQREKAAKTLKDWYGVEPRVFSRYEDLVALDDVDAVMIATPDFVHCRILADAIKAGKDVYIEKPMASKLEDAKAAVDVVKDSGRIVQVGTQRRSDGRWKGAVKMMRSGILGTVSRVEISWNDCGPRWKRGTAGVKEEDVDWKAFLAGSPDRPFNASQFREWHLYREFTNGPTATLGSHYMDVASWMMDDPFPSTAVAHGGHYVWKDGREHEDTIYILFDYPKGYICRYLTGLGNSAEHGCRIYGTNGMFSESTWSFTGAGGSGKDKIKEEIKVQAEPGESHVKNWMECIRSRKTPNAPIEVGYQHSVATILGQQALVTGRKMKYMPALRRIVEA